MEDKELLCSYVASENDAGSESFLAGPSGNLAKMEERMRNCLYCSNRLVAKKANTLWYGTPGVNPKKHFSLNVCEACGWWIVTDAYFSIGSTNPQRFFTQTFGMAKYYEEDSIRIPIDELRKYMSQHPERMTHINPTRFELLIKDCLQDQYPGCEIVHTGQTADGGIDLKMILTENDTYLIQVKRRTSITRSEGVAVVRELNGVLFREGLAKGMVVTTAGRFTTAAKREASYIQTPTKYRYEMKLLAFNDIASMLRLPRQVPYEPWRDHLERLTSNWT